MAADVWALLRAERTAVADYLAGVSEDEWAKPSLCAGWSNHDVLAHLVSGAKSTPPTFLVDLVRSGFSFNRFAALGVRRQGVRSNADLVKEFRSLIDKRTQPGKAMVGEAMVHADDISRALGGSGAAHDPDAVRAVADHYVKGNGPIGAKKRLAGLRLVATDTDWSHGDGSEVKGSLVDLVVAMTGRSAVVDALEGPGVATLRSRC